MATEVKVPTLGESVTEATVGQWLKKPGEAVAADEPIVSLETDKVAVDVPAPAAGTMGDIVAKEGDTVEVGALLGYVNEGAAAAAGRARGLPQVPPIQPCTRIQILLVSAGWRRVPQVRSVQVPIYMKSP